MPLNETQVTQYEAEGYLCPIDVFPADEALSLRSELEALEKECSGIADREAMLKNNSNWVIPWFDRLSRTPVIVNAVSSILGPDLLALSIDLFIKEPHTDKFISWHQDLHYWGLDSDEEVTAWLALSPATPESGCMRFVPGSHRTVVEHRDTFGDDNMLSRGQELSVEVDEYKAVYAALQPGQMSLHHGRMFHASTANRTDDRRIGIAMRYISPNVSRESAGAKMGASLVKGEDRRGNFDLVEPPSKAFESAAMENWLRLRQIEEEILFDGARKAG